MRATPCLKLVILLTSKQLRDLYFSISFISSGDAYSQGAASPISTPNIAKRKSVNDRSVCPDFFSPSSSVDNFRKLRPKSVVDNGEGYTAGPGIIPSTIFTMTAPTLMIFQLQCVVNIQAV